MEMLESETNAPMRHAWNAGRSVGVDPKARKESSLFDDQALGIR